MQNGFTVWLTGLSGAGKSTLARALQRTLIAEGCRVEVLDGDEVRALLSDGLGFSKSDRDTNVRRIGHVAKLLARNGVAVLVAAISPYRQTREEVRAGHKTPFVEVFVDCSLDVLVRRDPKGLYAKALRGDIPHFSGISDPYEPPLSPDVVVRTDLETETDCCSKIVAELRRRELIGTGVSVSTEA